MPVTAELIDEALRITKRFAVCAGEVKARIAREPAGSRVKTAENAALKRASMDLSRALSKLRRSEGRSK